MNWNGNGYNLSPQEYELMMRQKEQEEYMRFQAQQEQEFIRQQRQAERQAQMQYQAYLREQQRAEQAYIREQQRAEQAYIREQQRMEQAMIKQQQREEKIMQKQAEREQEALMKQQEVYQRIQDTFDKEVLVRLGYSAESVNQLYELVITCNGKVSVQNFCNMGYDYVTAKDMKYMYDLAIGRIVVDSERELIKHLKRTFGRQRRIGITDLTVSKVNSVPRVAVVAGINKEPFTIYNSKQYEYKDMFYKVVDISRTRITVETSRKPKIKWGESKKVDGMVEILERTQDGKVRVAFDKSVCRLCNRFIVVASLKRPEFHLGLAEILCIDGTKVYVYAQLLKPTETIRYNNGTQRVYSYGYTANEIEKQVLTVAREVYSKLHGVTSSTSRGNQEFTLLAEEPQDKMGDESIENIEFDD